MQITSFHNEVLGETYYGFQHKSGLQVYVYPKEMSTSYALFATKYGSLENRFMLTTDSEFTTVPAGIAHFLEHKMFENEDGVDTFELFGKTGASANAYTSFDKTAYLFSSTDQFYPFAFCNPSVFHRRDGGKRAGNHCAGNSDVRG